MKEKEQTENLARGSVLNSEAYQWETVVSVVCMQKQKHANS